MQRCAVIVLISGNDREVHLSAFGMSWCLVQVCAAPAEFLEVAECTQSTPPTDPRAMGSEGEHTVNYDEMISNTSSEAQTTLQVSFRGKTISVNLPSTSTVADVKQSLE